MRRVLPFNLLLAVLLAACVTVNVYFPAAAAQSAAIGSFASAAAEGLSWGMRVSDPARLRAGQQLEPTQSSCRSRARCGLHFPA